MTTDWTKIYRRHKGQWVALKDDEKTVIGSGKTAKEAFSQALEKGYKKPILTHMPKKLVGYIGNV